MSTAAPGPALCSSGSTEWWRGWKLNGLAWWMALATGLGRWPHGALRQMQILRHRLSLAEIRACAADIMLKQSTVSLVSTFYMVSRFPYFICNHIRRLSHAKRFCVEREKVKEKRKWSGKRCTTVFGASRITGNATLGLSILSRLFRIKVCPL